MQLLCPIPQTMHPICLANLNRWGGCKPPGSGTHNKPLHGQRDARKPKLCPSLSPPPPGHSAKMHLSHPFLPKDQTITPRTIDMGKKCSSHADSIPHPLPPFAQPNTKHEAHGCHSLSRSSSLNSRLEPRNKGNVTCAKAFGALNLG